MTATTADAPTKKRRRANNAIDPLTPEQQAVAAENVHLAKWWLGENPWPVRWFGGDEALSLAQLAVARAARDYRPETGWTFATYVATCIRNEMLREAGRRQHPKRKGGWSVASLDAPHGPTEATLAEVVQTPEEPERDLAGFEAAERVADLLRRLPPQEREVMQLRHLAQLSYAQIAEWVGLSKQRVKQVEQMAVRRPYVHCGMADPATIVERKDDRAKKGKRKAGKPGR